MILNESFFAVWQPGSGGQRWHPDLDAGKFESLHSSYAEQGMHLTAIDIWRASPVPPRRSYCGVWQSGAVTQYLEPSLSIAEFKAQDDTHFAKGRRLAAFDIDETGRICALWQAGSGNQLWCADYKFADILPLSKEQHKLGMRLSMVRQHGQDKFAAVWHPGSGAQWWAAGMSEDGFKGSDSAYLNSGLRLNCLDCYSGTFNAVWGPGAGTQQVHWNMSFGELKSLDDGYFAQGLRLKVLKRAGIGKSAHK